jgi:hypothetical protein
VVLFRRARTPLAAAVLVCLLVLCLLPGQSLAQAVGPQPQGQPPAQPAASSRPVVQAYRVERPPTIDGLLDDEAWRHLPIDATEWLSYNPLHGDKIPQQTRVWVAYDDHYFYFAFRCDDPSRARSRLRFRDGTTSGTTTGSASASIRSAPASCRTT